MGIVKQPRLQVTTKTIGCFLNTSSQVPLLKTTITELTEYGIAELVPTRSLHLFVLVSLMLKRYSIGYQSET